MRKIILVTISLLIVPLAASAQTPQVQFYGGYAYTHTDSGGLTGAFDAGSRNWNGWEASFATNFTRYVGVAFDFSGAYGPAVRSAVGTFTLSVREQTPYMYAYMVGPQFLLPMGRVKLFAHGLAGATQVKRGFTGVSFPVVRSDFAFGSAVGAGIDVSLTRYVALRLGQADYLISKNFGGAQNNLRVSGGIVFEFGGR
ncbi:MAG TPA: outer membrane beta-barrel protein [Acidobacteriota bacterium]|nr:outer membrane beta-barrel protein [Acidobacteriota bacterium]